MSDLIGRLRPATDPTTRPPRLRDSVGKTWGWWAIVAVAALAFPMVIRTDYVFFLAGGVGIYALVGIGMNLLYGLGGQASLGQGALVAVGAYTSGVVVLDHGWGMWPALILALGAGAATGAVMGLPSLRLSTWYFALVTLAFAQAVTGVIQHFPDVTGGNDGLVGIVVPLTTQQLYWVILVANALGLVIYWTFANSRLGRALIAVRDGGGAGTVSGVRGAPIKLLAFGVAGAYAGVAGALFGFEQQVITPEQFNANFSIFFVVIVVAGGVGRLLGPVVGALAFFAVPEFLHSLDEWRMVIYGVALLLFMAFAPDGLLGAGESLVRSLRTHLRLPGAPTRALSGASEREVDLSALLAVESADGRTGERLRVEDVTMTFGGIKALQGVSLDLAPGRVYGLVGPNGSGKTTLLNVITGLYLPSAGGVRIDGESITGVAPTNLVRHGLARTFQTPRLLPDLSVWENVMLGAHTGESATALEVLARLPRNRRDTREFGQRAHDLLTALGLGKRAGDRAGDLPHGHQRMVEIARALMLRPHLLLLDEPAAGMSADELATLDALVRELGAGGVTVLLVEHHIGWVREICGHVTVLDQGQIVTAGDPDDVFTHPRVRETYLGLVA